MRRWTKSACVVIAWCIALFAAVTGSQGAGPAQTTIRIASSSSSSNSSSSTSSSSTQATTAVKPAVLTAVVQTAAPAASAAPRPLTWTVRPGDTLSGIAAALTVPGGWQALYSANRRLIGPDPDTIRVGTVLTLPGAVGAARYTVAPGDTLSGVAAALGVPGGWQALYQANRKLIGASPNALQAGTVLTIPHQAASAAPGGSAGRSAGTGSKPPAARPQPPHGTPSVRPAPVGSASPAGGSTVPAGRTSAGIMPGWLKATLLFAALLTMLAFLAEPAVVIARRRRRASRPAAPRAPSGSAPDGHFAASGESAVEQAARIIEAHHERLIVTYSVHDHTIYLLTPPGEDPRTVLRAARLVVPEPAYQDLAGHLGVPPAWGPEGGGLE